MPIITEHHVNFYDTDAMAVVHHSNYIRWFETGRVAYLRKYGITLGEMMEDGYVFPITEVRCACRCAALTTTSASRRARRH